MGNIKLTGVDESKSAEKWICNRKKRRKWDFFSVLPFNFLLHFRRTEHWREANNVSIDVKTMKRSWSDQASFEQFLNESKGNRRKRSGDAKEKIKMQEKTTNKEQSNECTAQKRMSSQKWRKSEKKMTLTNAKWAKRNFNLPHHKVFDP